MASWLRAAALGKDFRQYCYFLASLGPRAGVVVAVLLRLAVGVILPGERLLFGLDDTPTKRYGPHVEGAGVHHNPTPGPADQTFLYGHVWVTLALLVRHPLWGGEGLRHGASPRPYGMVTVVDRARREVQRFPAGIQPRRGGGQ